MLARKSFWPYHAREPAVACGTSAPPGDAERLRERFLAAHPELQGRGLLSFLIRIHKKKGCDRRGARLQGSGINRSISGHKCGRRRRLGGARYASGHVGPATPLLAPGAEDRARIGLQTQQTFNHRYGGDAMAAGIVGPFEKQPVLYAR